MYLKFIAKLLLTVFISFNLFSYAQADDYSEPAEYETAEYSSFAPAPTYNAADETPDEEGDEDTTTTDDEMPDTSDEESDY